MSEVAVTEDCSALRRTLDYTNPAKAKGNCSMSDNKWVSNWLVKNCKIHEDRLMIRIFGVWVTATTKKGT